jgi:hypothetical protein
MRESKIIRRQYLVKVGDRVLVRLSNKKNATDYADNFNTDLPEGITLAYVCSDHIYKQGVNHESKSFTA